MAFDPRWKNPQGSSPEMLYLWAQDIIKELRRGQFIPDAQDAAGVAYDNTISGLAADNVQDAIDEEDARIDALEAVPPPGLVLLNSGTVTNAATLDIVLTAFTAYRGLRFLLGSFVPQTDAVTLGMLFSTNGGNSFLTTLYAYASTGVDDQAGGSAFTSNNSNQAQILLSGGFALSNVVAEGGGDWIIDLLDQNASRWPRVFHRSARISSSGAAITQSGIGMNKAQNDVNAVRFVMSSGNIASGNWAVYGYA